MQVGEAEPADALPPARGGTRPGRRLLWLGLVVAAVALGVYADVGLRASGAWGSLPLVATPWLVLSFAAGRAGRGLPSGVLAGTAMLLVGLASYYAWLAVGQDVALGTILQQYRAPVWLAAGLVVGAGYGLLGASTRSRRRVLRELAWCGLVAVPVVDVVLPVRLDGAAASPVLVVLAGVVAALLWWAFRDRTLRRTHVVLGAATVAFALWQCEVLVLRVVFGRNV